MTVIDCSNITGAKAPVAPVLNTPLNFSPLEILSNESSKVRCYNSLISRQVPKYFMLIRFLSNLHRVKDLVFGFKIGS